MRPGCVTPEAFRAYEDVVLRADGDCYLVGETELERVSNVLSGRRDGYSSPFMKYHAAIGTATHRLIEQFFTGRMARLDDVTPKKQDTDFLQMVACSCANFQYWVRGLYAVVPIAVEVTYPHRGLGYAGTTDLVAWIQRSAGSTPYRASIDHKTGGEIRKRDKLQQAAYSMARLGNNPNARVDEVGIVRFDKKALGVVDEWFVEEDGSEMRQLKEEWADKAERGI